VLTADQLDALVDPIVALYEEYNQSVINDIARRLAGLGIAKPTAAWQMQRLTESGKVYENALDELAKLTGKSESELRAMFQKAGVKALRFDDAIYRAAGLKPMPLNLSPAMAQVLAAGLRKTQGVIKNLTLTTAIDGQNAFLNAADLAYMQVSSGAMSYTQALRDGVKQMASEGLSVIQFPGRRDQLDVAMRRTLLTGVSQTTGELQTRRADEMGVDLVQTSAHIGARPSHQVWQGRIVSRSGQHSKYPDFVKSTGYGSGPGLGGWNCRHSFYPFFEGISENAYSKAELDSYASKTVKYNGEEMSFYDATQQQRGIERKIRYWKRQEGALKAAKLDASSETAKVREWQARMRDFKKQTGLIRQPERERVLYTQNLEKQTPKVDFRSPEYQRVADLGDVRSSYDPADPGVNYAVSRPVIYNQFAYDHLMSDDLHRARLPWLERNAGGLAKAISSPAFIEKQLRLRRDGFFSTTHIAELVGEAGEDRYIVVAISLSKNMTGGYHQITTIHPAKWKDIFKSNGTLRDKYIHVK
jgi:hypothetical protein